ncbi:MAG: nucleotidyltransferase domain-containing protein [Myxococcales bacterium]|nr:nucleotidyltransferase domain-containing protein [Myxococcales bacterium]
MSALGLKPQDFIIDIPDEAAAPIEKIAPIIDRLHEEFPDVTFILFGSRAKGTAAKYSDWDIGALRAGGLPHDEYKKVLIRKDELVEDFPYFVDMVNLDRADAAFLREASRGWVFLTGRLADWIEFKKGVAA